MMKYGDLVEVIGFYKNKYKDKIGMVVGLNPYKYEIEVRFKNIFGFYELNYRTFPKKELKLIK